jgi:hypothetical protein
MTGNRVRIKYKGQYIGYGVQNVSFQRSYGLQRVDGLGGGKALELVPGEINYTCNLSSFYIPQQRLDDLKIVDSAEEIMTSTGIDIEIQDNVSGRTLDHYIGCKCNTYTTNYGKFAICGQDASFIALDYIE